MMRISHIIALVAVAASLSACNSRTSNKERILFEGLEFKAKAKPVERKTPQQFEVSVKKASQSAEGARQAGIYEATSYCVLNYGTSEIDWIGADPTSEDTQLVIADDQLILQGSCRKTW